MANLFKNPTHEAKIGYNGFDMSHLIKFTSTVGELLPVYYDILQPGDKVSLQTILKTRTMPLETAAMASITEHIEWFFVPMNQIYSIFGDWYDNIQDFKSSLFSTRDFSTSGAQKLPFFKASLFNEALLGGLAASDRFGYQSGLRLAELLGVPIPTSDSRMTPNRGYCPILACAYQKIYSDYYRLTDREPNDSRLYNLDQFYGDRYDDLDVGDLIEFFTLRYRPWKRDPYTFVFVSPLMGNGDTGAFPRGSASPAVDNYNQWLSYISNSTVIRNDSENIESPYHPTAVSMDMGPMPLTPTAIRTSFAVQKLLEITRRSGKHYDAQTLAHFGVKVPMGIAGECTFIGGSDSKIMIGDVIATASGEGNALGQVAGKGYNQDSSRTLKFSAPCHGILMAIYSAEPEADYTFNAWPKFNNMEDRSSWYYPEYDNLGMQPQFVSQTGFRYSTSSTDSASPAINNTILGWQYRYMEFKCKQNYVYGGLSRTLKVWSPQISGFAYSSSTVIGSPDENRFWISPNYLDSIFAMGYNPELPEHGFDVWQTDPLLHELYFNVKKSSKMSTYGLESL